MTSVAAAVSAGGVFLGTLLIVSIITARISDMVLDSRVGALDRTLGFLFGLGPRARSLSSSPSCSSPGWCLTAASPEWVRSAKSKRGAAKHWTMVDVDVAGRPREHHLKEAEETEA